MTTIRVKPAGNGACHPAAASPTKRGTAPEVRTAAHSTTEARATAHSTPEARATAHSTPEARATPEARPAGSWTA